jgi:transketolase
LTIKHNRRKKLEELKTASAGLRKDIIEMIYTARAGHPGGSLSAVDIINVLYNYKMKHDPENPGWAERDRFIMSKGHASPALYAVLGNCGYFPGEEFKSFRKFGGLLQGHVHRDVPGVELSTGSLGQGLSVASGMALGSKLAGKNSRVYCMLGDGEMQEGQVWETVMTAAQYRLDNLCAILDYNGIQENGRIDRIKKLEPVTDKLKDFGWEVLEIDGHDYVQIADALDNTGAAGEKPLFIKANTVKGKGISYMEDRFEWHAKNPDKEQLAQALKELGFKAEIKDGN